MLKQIYDFLIENKWRMIIWAMGAMMTIYLFSIIVGMITVATDPSTPPKLQSTPVGATTCVGTPWPLFFGLGLILFGIYLIWKEAKQ